MTNTAPTTEQAHDERVLELLAETEKAAIKTAHRMDTLRWVTLDRRNYGGLRTDRRTGTEVVATIEALIAAGDAYIVSYGATPSELLASYTEAVDAQLEVGRTFHAHEANYTGWQRYWLVVSSAGLVHASQGCHTCNKGRSATLFALLPSLSGRSHEALVEALGPSLCSVCWPDAPVAWTDEQRISPTVTAVLLNQGEEAFWTALAESRARSAKRAATKARNDAALAARRAARAAQA
jgi:hypothetical protein